MKELARGYYQRGKYFSANYGLARSHYNKYILGRERVEAKVYLYTLRALAACKYACEYPYAPDVDFPFANWFREKDAILDLIEQKKRGVEAGDVIERSVNTLLKGLIVSDLADLANYWDSFEYKKPDLRAADEFLIGVLI